MYFSLKSDAKEDRRNSSEDRKDIINMMRNTDRKFDEFAKEIKDFHGRMCTLEEKYIQMMQRFMERK
jgi:hypothetical protein